MPVANERKSLFARKDLADRLVDIAKGKGVSLYNLVNEVFSWYIRLENAGIDVYEILEKISLYNRLKGAGFILVPKDLWLCILKEFYEKEVEVNANRWFDVGVRLGKYYHSLPLENQLSVLLKDLENILGWAGEVQANLSDRSIDVVIAGPDLTNRLAESIVELLKGIFREFGYTLEDLVILGGVVRVLFGRQVMR